MDPVQIPDTLPKDIEKPDPFANGKTPVKPTGNGLIVRPDNPEVYTKGGILLPDTAKKKQLRGRVVATGPGNFDARGERIPMEVEVGQMVMWGAYAGIPISVNEVEFVRLSANEITLIVEDPSVEVKNLEGRH